MIWVLRLTLRSVGIGGWRWLAPVVIALSFATALPWLASLLLTDIFAGLAVLAVYLLFFCAGHTSRAEKAGLLLLLAFAGATHSATFAVMLGLCTVGWIVWPFLRPASTSQDLAMASASIVMAAAMLLLANYALSKQVAWTPGGYGILFGRMLQDGIVKRYLDDHCATVAFKLCPHRAQLPPTADEFLWANSVFNQLGRFAGLNDEMRAIVLGALRDYPVMQARAALLATAQQLVMVRTGEEHPRQALAHLRHHRALHAGRTRGHARSRQQRGLLSFEAERRPRPHRAFVRHRDDRDPRSRVVAATTGQYCAARGDDSARLSRQRVCRRRHLRAT